MKSIKPKSMSLRFYLISRNLLISFICFIMFYTVFLHLIFSFNSSSFLFANENIYARINDDNVYIYSQPINSNEFRLFRLPQTYFVLLVDNANDEADMFFKVYYMDILGYVKKSQVFAVNGAPLKPFAENVLIGTFSFGGLELKKSPENSANFDVIIPFRKDNIEFYGEINGDVFIPELNVDTWYYCKYIDEGKIYYGYLYKALCFPLSLIIEENNENFSVYTGELFPETLSLETSVNLNDELKIVIIVCACLPCFLIIYLLFKPTKLIVDNGKKRGKKLNRLKRSEYYEFDD